MMEKIPTFLPVVALAALDGAGRVLLQQRPAQKHHGGLWEFPGGKVEPFEKPRDALFREIAEELSVNLDRALLKPAGWSEEEGERPIVLLLYTSHQELRDVHAREGQQWGWFSWENAQRLPLAPMDRQLLLQLQF